MKPCNLCFLRKDDSNMEIKSLLIKDTTKEERIRIVQEGLNQCGGACDFCNGCDWQIFDERMKLCKKALMYRHNRLKGTLSDRSEERR